MPSARRKVRIEEHVAWRLREARAGLSVSQESLAAMVGCKQETISLWESCLRRISLVQLDALAHALGQPLSYFLDYDMPEDEYDEQSRVEAAAQAMEP